MTSVYKISEFSKGARLTHQISLSCWRLNILI